MRPLPVDDPRFPTTPAARALLQSPAAKPAPVPATKPAAPAVTKPSIPAVRPVPAVKAPPPVKPASSLLPPDGAIVLGAEPDGRPIWVELAKLMEGRLLIQGVSGAGKSWLLRRLLEESAGFVQQLVIDPEGEFRSFAESADYPVIDGDRIEGYGFASLGTRLRLQRLSAVIDISQMDREAQMIAVAGLLRALVEAPRENWHPLLVAIDEAHLFAPYGGSTTESSGVRKAVIGAVVDLMSRGRKRGLAGVMATQRLARLSKSVTSEAGNFLIGRNTLDLDIRRAADMVGWDARRGFELLPGLEPGNFIAAGPAFNLAPATVAIGGVRSRHLGATPAMSPPPMPGADEAAELLGVEDLAEAEPVEVTPRHGYKLVRGFIRNPSAPLALRIWHELLPLWPDGAARSQMAGHFGATEAEISAAIEMLQAWNAVEVGPSVRVERSLQAVATGKGRPT